MGLSQVCNHPESFYRLVWLVNHPDHFFKYCTARTAKSVLETQTVRWSSPEKFNDPFDCSFSLAPHFDWEPTTAKWHHRLLDILCDSREPDFDQTNPESAWINKLRKIAAGKSRSTLKGVMGSLFEEFASHMEQWSDTEREIWKIRAASFRLFCVCIENDNILLWSHYADSHSGVVLQFECIKELDVPLLGACEVQYSKVAPSISPQEEFIEEALGLRPLKKGEEVHKKLITTKAIDWKYEHEWRVVSTRRDSENQGNNYEDIPFHPPEISKVFLGCKIDSTDRANILKLLQGRFAHVEAYQAKRNARMFKVDFDRIK